MDISEAGTYRLRLVERLEGWIRAQRFLGNELERIRQMGDRVEDK